MPREQIYPGMLEGLKNDVMLPYIREHFEFPFCGRLYDIRNIGTYSSAEDVAESIVAHMSYRNVKSERSAMQEMDWLLDYGTPYSETGAVAALLDASGYEGEDILDEVDSFFRLSEFVERFDNDADLLEVIDGSSDIDGEIGTICRLLQYDAGSIWSSMDAYRAGVPLEDILA